ncbi:zinc finger CCCH domain-containing protein 64-like isoform X1 [Glycine soja]|uniref:Zinc finger CCCH domain-containing protein 64 isoform A n=2 Tax=Glycine soja TaxID=3848 RepID=A0A445HDT9_GLYSO|nr:zinc finger CCCH domain-containing protein 64-like isoform X1 [Glycine soja]XP_028198209.1 zinc finger CCCH domain-containing protein 64-like isoform X1 [Glycine soja]RZB71822.1 Zinc finger CCCH domain-containing protein 64 isoform A [Glycine soja]RZB71823.1 Zinc finger CCCH domain-containing protein 64 isoform B [Glycine soja]
MAPRILLCGDVLGRLNQLFKRVSSVNKSAGPFDALLCVGQFFPDSPEQLEDFTKYIEGGSHFPLPTYFVGDYGVAAPKLLLQASKDSANQGFKMDGFKVCHNLYWLKGSGKFSLFGLSVAYLSGRKSSSAQQFGTYTEDDVDALRAIAEEPGIVDLFLTNEWPSGVTNRAADSDIPAGLSDAAGGDSTVSELVQEIKPRYHIAGTKGIYYAREPYSNVDAVHVTRFIGLASVGNKDKQKFIHAISPTPASTMSSTEIAMKTTNTTLSPYTYEEKRTSPMDSTKRSSDSISDPQYWRYDVSQKRQKHEAGHGDKLCFKFVSSGSCPRGEKCNFRHDTDAREQCMRGVCFDFLNKGKCERGPDCNFKHSLQDEGGRLPSRRPGSGRSKECWFCLSSPNVESHLIISIGENYYLALAKGPLVEDHVLIIPVEHMPSTLSMSSESEIELSRFQNSLKSYCKSQEKEVIFFEWVSVRGTHANLQAIPIPSSKAIMAEKIFNLAAQKLRFEFVTKKFDSISDGRKFLKAQIDGDSSLFYAQIPGGTILLHHVEEKEKFPAQFGREVLAGLLNMADNADWRNRKHSKDEEMKIVEVFKSRFQEYDPNC